MRRNTVLATLTAALAFWGIAAAQQAGKRAASETAPSGKKPPVKGAPAAEKAAFEPGGKQASAEDARTADQAAIVANIDAFEAAYNKGDAKAIAGLFTPEAQIIDDEGVTVQGREAIERVFTELFADRPEGTITLDVGDLKFLGSALAIETGESTVIPAPHEPAVHNEYTVVHVKSRDGKWLMALARDTPGPSADHTENLMPLAFLIGDWVDESSEAVVHTTYAWADGNKFILGKFSVKLAGREELHGTQRLAWDPIARKVRSWVFDSEGGFLEGLWTRVEDQWLIKFQGVSSDGNAASSTALLTYLSPERWTWQSRDRISGSELLPDGPEIVVVRRPPDPDGVAAADAREASPKTGAESQ